VGLAKPDPAIYEILCRRHGLRPETSFFVDDSLPNVEAARTLGFAGAHFVDARGLRAELKVAGAL
jgi:2-haloacid dehalogenase